MSGEIPSRISNSTPIILMIAMSFLCWTRAWMNAFKMSTTATSMFSSESMMHVSSTDSVTTVDELASSLEIKYLCLLPTANVLLLMVPYIFSFKNRWDFSVCFFYSCDMFFQYIWRKMSLVCSFLI